MRRGSCSNIDRKTHEQNSEEFKKKAHVTFTLAFEHHL